MVIWCVIRKVLLKYGNFYQVQWCFYTYGTILPKLSNLQLGLQQMMARETGDYGLAG